MISFHDYSIVKLDLQRTSCCKILISMAPKTRGQVAAEKAKREEELNKCVADFTYGRESLIGSRRSIYISESNEAQAVLLPVF